MVLKKDQQNFNTGAESAFQVIPEGDALRTSYFLAKGGVS